MVDMSSHAVTARLRMMGELWELSVKLMNSKVISSYNIPSKKDRPQEIQSSIRRILFYEWDPIGISQDSEWPDDEYDSYIAPVYRILTGTRSQDDIINCLHRIERDTIGVACDDPESLRPVAKKLLELDLR